MRRIRETLRLHLQGGLSYSEIGRALKMWLTGRLAPDFKTIADFRHDNPAGIRNVFSHFVSICRQLKLLSQSAVAVDGSKFKAVNNRVRNFTPHKLAKRMEQVEESIASYMATLDTADRTQPLDLQAKTTGFTGCSLRKACLSASSRRF